MSVDETHPANTREFALFVKRTSVDELRRIMHGERRGTILNEIFTNMPDVFRADRAGSLNATIHWNVGDRPDGGAERYELVIANGTCALSPRPAGEPNLALTIGAVDFLRLVTGNVHAVALVMRGKLKTKGDLGLTAKFPTLFDVPKV
jgi:putative sterol carrier protein